MGGRVLRHGMSPVGIGQSGVPMFSPMVVSAQPRSFVARGVPELREAGVDIDIHAARNAFENWWVREVPADVDQRVGVGGKLGDPRRRRSAERRAIRAEERGVFRQAEARRHAAKVLHRPAVRLARELFEKEDAPAERLEAQHPVQPHPRLAAVPGFVRQRAAHDDRPRAHPILSSSRVSTLSEPKCSSASARAARQCRA